MTDHNSEIKGLTDEQVLQAREKYGFNRLDYKKESGFVDSLKGFVKDPMVILLLVASAIYFISNKVGDGLLCLLPSCSHRLYRCIRIREAAMHWKD